MISILQQREKVFKTCDDVLIEKRVPLHGIIHVVWSFNHSHKREVIFLLASSSSTAVLESVLFNGKTVSGLFIPVINYIGYYVVMMLVKM